MLHAAVLAEAEKASVSGSDKGILVVIAVVAVFALLVAAYFAREVLRFDKGTPKMQDISRAVQEGAAAYLRRQFTTLAPFAVIIFGLLFILPADTTGSRVGRSVFFLVGAGFSAFVGWAGMTLATRANVRMAAAANTSGPKPAMRVAFRSGGTVGMLTVGLGLRCSCVSAAASSRRRPTSGPTSWARSSRAFRRTTHETLRRSRTTSVTTSATARAWPPTSSSPTP
jgi:K(+)-stimulated pyrophosphate-energized sodium pump